MPWDYNLRFTVYQRNWIFEKFFRYIADVLKPVSYTHLDVYKRQVYSCAKSIVLALLAIEILSHDVYQPPQ